MEEIKKEYFKKQAKNYLKDDKNVILRHALTKNSIYSLANNQDDIKDMDFWERVLSFFGVFYFLRSGVPLRRKPSVPLCNRKKTSWCNYRVLTR